MTNEEGKRKSDDMGLADIDRRPWWKEEVREVDDRGLERGNEWENIRSSWWQGCCFSIYHHRASRVWLGWEVAWWPGLRGWLVAMEERAKEPCWVGVDPCRRGRRLR